MAVLPFTAALQAIVANLSVIISKFILPLFSSIWSKISINSSCGSIPSRFAGTPRIQYSFPPNSSIRNPSFLKDSSQILNFCCSFMLKVRMTGGATICWTIVLFSKSFFNFSYITFSCAAC